VFHGYSNFYIYQFTPGVCNVLLFLYLNVKLNHYALFLASCYLITRKYKYFPQHPVRHPQSTLCLRFPRVSIKGKVFWVVTLCNLEAAQCFEGTYCPHLHCRKVNQARNPTGTDSKLSSAEDGGNMYLWNVKLFPQFMALQPRSPHSSWQLLWDPHIQLYFMFMFNSHCQAKFSIFM
jgi:hypothetical protein